MTDYLQKCISTPARALAGVVFPTSGFSAAQLSSEVDGKLIDEGVVAGEKIFVVQGCFAYQTVNITRHSAFCFFYRADQTGIEHLNVLPIWELRRLKREIRDRQHSVTDPAPASAFPNDDPCATRRTPAQRAGSTLA